MPSNHLRTAVLLIAVGAACAPGCSGCSEKAPLALVPHDATIVVLVPSIDKAVRHFNAFGDKLKGGLLSGALINKQMSALADELGFDPLKPETMKTKGVDPKRGLVISVTHEGVVTAVFGATDRSALDKYLRAQLKKVFGGDATFKEQKVDGVSLTTVKARDVEQLVAWTYVDKNIVISSSADGNAGKAAAHTTKLEKSIKDNPRFAAVTDKLDEQDITIFIDGVGARKASDRQAAHQLENASEWMKKYIEERRKTAAAALGFFEGGGIGIRFKDDELGLRAYYAFPKDKGKTLMALFAGKGEGPAFGKSIGPEAVVVARASLDLKRLLDVLFEIVPPQRKRAFYRKLERAEREHSFSLEKDLLRLLSGHYAAALYAPQAGDIKEPPRGIAEALGVAPLVLMAGVTDEKAAAELLDRLERFLVMRGMDLRPKTEGERRVFVLERDGRAVASWTIYKKLFVLATGDRLGPTLALIDKGGANVLDQIGSTRARNALKESKGGMIAANLAKIGKAVQGLDLGMEIKLMLTPVFSALDKFRDVSLVVEPHDDGVVADFAVVLN